MKTYVLTLSRTFPKGHPREGEETYFYEAFMRGIAPAGFDRGFLSHSLKLHTIRADWEVWRKRVGEVNAGKAVLSVRQWLGAPRRSKQRELFRFDRNDGIGVEKLEISRTGECAVYMVNERGYWLKRRTVEAEALSNNDGLTLADWRAWFRDCDKSQPMAIIHFTEFRYCK